LRAKKKNTAAKIVSKRKKRQKKKKRKPRNPRACCIPNSINSKIYMEEGAHNLPRRPANTFAVAIPFSNPFLELELLCFFSDLTKKRSILF
jgi:hypothetical protein